MENNSSKANIALRNPALINKNKKQNLIYSPANKASHFIKIAQITDKNKRATAIAKAAHMYNVFENGLEIHSALPSLYDFAFWLTEHKNNLSFSAIKRNTNTVKVLTETQELFIWENLIYQIIENKSNTVKEVLIKLLVANDFLKAFVNLKKHQIGYLDTIVFTTDQQKEFTQRAHATVVITEELPIKTITSSPIIPSLKEQRRQFISVERLLLKNKLQLYKNTLIELEDILALCNREKDNNFHDAITRYHKEIDDLIEGYDKENTKMIDAMTNEIMRKALAIDLFSYQPQKPIDINSVLNQLTDASKEIIQRDILGVCSTLPEAVTSLKQSIKNIEKTISILDHVSSKALEEGIDEEKTETVTDVDYNFVRLQPKVIGGDYQTSQSITMVMQDDIEKTDIVSMSYTVTFNNEVSTSGTAYKVLKDTQTIVSLFPEEIEFPSNAIYYDITGNMITTDGREVTFDKRVSLSHDCNYGDFKTPSNSSG